MTTYAEASAAAASIVTNSGLLEDVVTGADNATVSLGGEAVKTVANAIKTITDKGTVKGFATKTAMDADLAHAAGTIAIVLTGAEAGYAYLKTGASGAGSWSETSTSFGTDTATNAAAISTLETNTANYQFLDGLEDGVDSPLAEADGKQQISTSLIEYAGNPTSNFASSSNTWLRFAVGCDVARPVVADTLVTQVDNVANIHTVRCKVYSRDKSSTVTTGPDVASGDRLIKTIDTPVADLTQSADNVFVALRVDLGELQLVPGKWYLFELAAYESDLTTSVSMGFRVVSSGTVSSPTQMERGYFDNSPLSWSNYGTGDNRICFWLFGKEGGDLLAGPRRTTELLAEAEDLPASKQELSTTYASSALNSTWTGTFTRWRVPFQLSEAGFLDYVRLYLQDTSGNGTTLKLKLYKRAADVGDTALLNSAAAYGALIHSASIPARDVFGGTTSFAYYDLPLGGYYLPSDSRMVVELELEDSGGNTVTLGMGNRSFTDASEAAWLKGEYTTSTGQSDVFATTSSNLATWCQPYTRRANLDLAKTKDVLTLFSEGEKLVSTNARSNSSFAVTTISGWGRAVQGPNTYATHYVQEHSGLNAATSLKLRVWSRPLGATDGSSTFTAPGSYASDVLLLTKTLAVADVAADATSSGFQQVNFGISELGWLADDKLYFFFIEALDGSSNPVAIGVRYGQEQASSEPDWSRGYFNTTSSSSIVRLSPSILSQLYYQLYGRSYSLIGQVKQNFVQEPTEVGALTTAQGLTATVPALTINLPSSNVEIASQPLTFAAPDTDTITGQAFTMAYSSTGGVLAGNDTGYQYITGVTVVRDSDSATLVEGTDYAIKPNTGRIYGLVDTANFACTLAFTGHKHRYDVVYYDTLSGTLKLQQGTDRIIDPEEYPATTPERGIELFKAYVTKDGVQLMPTYKWRKYAHLERKAAHQHWLEYCRACLPKTLKKLRAGSAVKLVGYGDSITALASGSVSVTEPNQNTDSLSKTYFTRYPADTLSTIPDNGSRITVGWNWWLKASLEAKYSSTITYNNWGVGGSTSADTTNNGLNATRLTAMRADNPDLVVLAFGMNEIGSTTTYGNIKDIIEALQSDGAEVIVLTTPMINVYGSSSSLQNWLYTHDELVRAALDTESAYVSTYALEYLDNGAGSGIARQNASNSNLVNHPGPAQLTAIGKYLASIF